MRLKDADAIMDALNIFNDKENGNAHFLNGIETAKEIITAAPTIEAEPVRHGKWIAPWVDAGPVCSECRHFADERTDYCPNCGAKMEVEE